MIGETSFVVPIIMVDIINIISGCGHSIDACHRKSNIKLSRYFHFNGCSIQTVYISNIID